MIFVRISVSAAAVLLGAWLGVLFTALVFPHADLWWACILGAAVAIICAPSSRDPAQSGHHGRPSWITGAIALVLILLALAFRTTNLGWSEFQGDEARALGLAAEVIEGRPEALFQHRKGPGEILTAAAALSLFGADSEALIRLPFAVAGIATLCAIAGITSIVVSPWWGVLAFGLALQDGILLGFSRIVQYQMPMLLFCSAGWVLILSGTWRRSPAWIGLFFGAALLCHYDAVFLVLPGLALCYFEAIRHNLCKQPFWIALFACSAVAAVFYLPFIRSPEFAHTSQYLAARASSVPLPTVNLPRWFLTWEIYSGAASAITLGLVTLLVFTSRFGLARTVLLSGAVLLAAILPLRTYPLLSLLIALGLVGLLIKTLSPRERFVAAVGFLPWILFGFLFAKPNTHFLVGIPPLLIFTCILIRGTSSLRTVVTTGIATIIIAIGLAGTLRHQQELFFAQRLERPRLKASVVEFGISHRTGLKAAAEFLADKSLAVSYQTNDDPLVAAWYLRGHTAYAPPLQPELVLTIQNPREPIPMPNNIEDDYTLLARVFVAQKRAVDIFQLKERAGSHITPERIYD